jgi:hypothetical protein
VDPISWVLLGALALALAVMAWRVFGWSLQRSPRSRPVPLGPVLGSHGAMRCAAAVNVLHALSAADSPIIAAAWDQLEGPLLEALPDCPPSVKPALAEALAECAQACANRAAAQGMMEMRNGLS